MIFILKNTVFINTYLGLYLNNIRKNILCFNNIILLSLGIRDNMII